MGLPRLSAESTFPVSARPSRYIPFADVTSPSVPCERAKFGSSSSVFWDCSMAWSNRLRQVKLHQQLWRIAGETGSRSRACFASVKAFLRPSESAEIERIIGMAKDKLDLVLRLAPNAFLRPANPIVYVARPSKETWASPRLSSISSAFAAAAFAFGILPAEEPRRKTKSRCRCRPTHVSQCVSRIFR